MRVRIDYETASLCNIRFGVWRYAEDPSTIVLCLAWRIDGGFVQSWRLGQPLSRLESLRDAISAGATVNAWNANFERAITEKVAVTQLQLPVPKVSQWEDTQAIARMCSLPGKLETCARVLGVVEQKDSRGKQLIAKLCKPKKGVLPDHSQFPKEMAELVQYCKQDVRTEQSVHEALPVNRLPDFERDVWIFDSNVNRRGVPVDVEMLKGAKKIQDRAFKEACGELSRITGGKVTSPGQRDRILAVMREHQVDIDGLTAEAVGVALKGELPPVVRRILELRKSTSQAAAKKFIAALNAVCRDGRVRGCHVYHKAHTGRWAGTIVQFQNLARPKLKLDEYDNQFIRDGDYDALAMLYGSPMQALRDAVRHMVRDPAGPLGVCDLSSIEARVLGWLAQDPKYLKAYREGLDLYVVTAAEIFSITYDEVTEDQRWVGKQAVLALGYSMGVDTFYEHCVKYRPDIQRSLLEKAVKAYRKTYHKIVTYWQTIEKGAIQAMIEVGKEIQVGMGVTFKMIKGYLTMGLPSGRRLWYPEAKLQHKKTSWGETKLVPTYMKEAGRLWVRSHTYGGRLTENAVQALSRDIIFHGMALLEDNSMPVCMHVHDEALSALRNGNTVDDMTKCLTKVPKWAPGLPLGAKGFEATFYRKG